MPDITTFTDEQFRNFVIKTGKSFPTTITNGIAFNQKKRARFMLGLISLASPRNAGTGLLTNIATLTALRDQMAASGSAGQRNAAMFATVLLTPPFQGTGTPNSAYEASQRRAVIYEAFRRRAAVAVTGTNYVSAQINWSYVTPRKISPRVELGPPIGDLDTPILDDP